MGGDIQTGSQSSAPSNPEVNPTLSKFLVGVRGKYDAGESAGNPAALTSGWASQLDAAKSPTYAAGVNGAMSDFADAAAGNQAGANDPYYKQLGDDTLRDVNSMFTTSGRFGSGSHVDTAVKALGDVNNANIGADRAWQTQAASALPSMFAAGQAPGSVQQSVGEQQRAAPWYNLGQGSSILAGTAGTGGSTTTESQPWWKVGTGLASSALGFL